MRESMKKTSGAANFYLLMTFLSLATPLLSQRGAPRSFRLPAELKEVSGLWVQAPDSLWWLNDGGNSPTLYRTNICGQLQAAIPLANTQNRDWEDLTYDTTGAIYLGDFGDNLTLRNDLMVYRYQPATGLLDSIRFHFPAGTHYNTEAFFWHQDSLHLFTKSVIRRGHLPTYHYVLPAQPGEHEAVLRDSLFLRKRVVTAAAIHPETGQVALLAYYFKLRLGFIPYSAANVFCFSDYPGGHYLLGKQRSRRISLLVATQYESIDFIDPQQLLVASEQTLFIKAKAKRVKWKE
jgi:hypothetical protein